MAIYFPNFVNRLIIGGMHPYPVTNVLDAVSKRQEIISRGMRDWVNYLDVKGVQISDYTKNTLLDNDNLALVAIDQCIIDWKGFEQLDNLDSIEILLYYGERDKSYKIHGKEFFEKSNKTKYIELKGLNHFTAFSESNIVIQKVIKFIS